jgi:lysyl-tRNA synthetase class 2
MVVSHRRRPAAWPFAALFAASGLFLMVYAAATRTAWLERIVVTVCGTTVSAAHAVLLGLVLITLAHGLGRRRRTAWLLVMALVVWSSLTEIEALVMRVPGEPWRLIPLALAAVSLIGARDAFPVLPDPHRIRQTAAVAAASGTTLLVIGGGSLFAMRGRFAAPLSATDLGREFVAAVAANTGPGDFQGPSWMLSGLALAGGLALIAVILTLFAAAPPPEPAQTSERAAVRSLVAHPDSDTLAPFALRYDKSYAFEPGRRAAVGYRVLAGAAVVGGDPVGARDAWPAAIDAFLDEAERRGWRPAVLGAGAEARQLWSERGVSRGFGIGDEVLVDVGTFSDRGRAMRNVRQAVKRTENAGVQVLVVPERELSADLSAELRVIYRDWLGRGTGHHGREHGFAMNLDAMAEGRHPDALLAIAFAPEGYAISFQRYLPAGTAGTTPALSLDVMPRDRLAPNGVNERLIVATIDYAATNGYAAVSLNFAAFRTLLEAYRRNPHALGRRARLTHRAIHLLDPLIQVESLYRFNAKFKPSWLPRAVLMRSWLDLPAFAIAAFGLEFALPYDRRHSRPGELRPGLPNSVIHQPGGSVSGPVLGHLERAHASHPADRTVSTVFSESSDRHG